MNDESILELEVSAAAGADGVASVRAIGEIDLAGADRFAAAFESDQVKRATGLVVDLREVTFLDSSGLRVLLGAARDSAERGFALVVAPGSPVERLLEISQVLDHLPVFEDVSEAIAAAGNAR